MAAAIVQDVLVSGSGVSSVNLTPASTVAGNVVLVSTYWAQTSRTVSSVADNGGNTWTLLTSNPQSSGTGVHKTIWVCDVVTPFTSITITASGSITTFRCKAVECSGVSTTDLVTQVRNSTAIAPDSVIGTVTLARRSLLLMFAGKDSASDTWQNTTSPVWTRLNTTQTWDEAFTFGVADPGTYDMRVDWDTSTTRNVLAIAVGLQEVAEEEPTTAVRFRAQIL
jgi:hypothetical protein